MGYKDIPDVKSINFQTDDISQLSDVEKTIAIESARLSFERRSQGGLRAYLVSMELLDDDTSEVQESLQELGSLVRSLGDECIGVIVQKKGKIAPSTFIGRGKAEEVALSCKELKIDYVAFDRELSPSQVRNLEKLLERPVVDRSGVILRIFSKNAKTREARTQVEIAQLEYLVPRISNAWIAWERQAGGGGGTHLRGAGETQLELDKRRMRDKLATLRKELEKIQRERETQRKSRGEEINVVLVGYTNAGKTTVMNGLTDSHLSANNALFETLDSSVRVLKGSTSPRILMTDTVGFIRNLPHSLVASFKSTLEEAARADLLLHVVDASHPRYKDQMKVTENVLSEIGAGEVPCVVVFNKTDQLVNEPRLPRILARSYPGSICVSAEKAEDIVRLRETVINYFVRDMEERIIDIPYGDSSRMGILYSHFRVLSTEWCDEVARFRVRASKAAFDRYIDMKPEPVDEGELTPADLGEMDDPWDSGGFSLENKKEKGKCR